VPRKNLGLYWLVFAAVCAFLCLPVVTCHYAPLVDYPSHLARAYILAHYNEIPIYQQNFVLVPELIPNLAIDIMGGCLLRFMGVTSFSRLFLAFIVLLFAAGCHMLGCAIRGRPTMIAILCTFFIYNSMLLYGFVNYAFGLGMFCITFACYLRYRQSWTLPRLLFVGALVFLSYLAHQSAYAFLAAAFLVVAVFDYVETSQRNRLLLAIVLVVPEVFLYFAHGHHGQRDIATDIYWSTPRQKIIGLTAFASSYSHRFDAGFLVVLFVLLVVAARLRESTRIVHSVRTAGFLFFACYLIMPYRWLSGSPVDARFIIPALLLIVLSFETRIPHVGATVLFTACLLLFCLRIATIWRVWYALDQDVAAQVEMFKALPEGASVYTAFLTVDSGAELSKTDRSFLHVSEYATITRHALIPTQFASPGQQPLLFRVRPHYKAPLLQSSEWIKVMRGYEFAWSYALPDPYERLMEANCTPIAKVGKGTLWRVSYVESR
jgi:hypothetical protein